MESEKPNLLPPEASEYLEKQHGVVRKVSTLAKLRCVSSDGPAFFKANRQILYPRSGLDQYAAKLLSALRRSTSDHDTACSISDPANSERPRERVGARKRQLETSETGAAD